jgi:hypothetical protein
MLLLNTADCEVISKHLKENKQRLVNRPVLNKLCELIQRHRARKKTKSKRLALKKMLEILTFPAEVCKSANKIIEAVEFSMRIIEQMLSGIVIKAGQKIRMVGRKGVYTISAVLGIGRFTVCGLRGTFSASAIESMVS